MHPIVSGPKRILEKNYEISTLQKAYVGEEIIKVKDYWVTHTTQNKLRCLNNFHLYSSSSAIYSGLKGDTYNIIGTVINENRRLYLIKFPNPDLILAYGITEYGYWADYASSPSQQSALHLQIFVPRIYS